MARCVLLIFTWIKCVTLPKKSRYYKKKPNWIQYNLVYFYIWLFTTLLVALNTCRQLNSNPGTFQRWITSVLSHLCAVAVLPVLQSYNTLTLYIYLKYFPQNRSHSLLILACFRIWGWRFPAHPVSVFLLQTPTYQFCVLFVLTALARGWGVYLNGLGGGRESSRPFPSQRWAAMRPRSGGRCAAGPTRSPSPPPEGALRPGLGTTHLPLHVIRQASAKESNPHECCTLGGVQYMYLL